ncbi:hypothetical protein [Thermogemmatispora sp.]|uniref:hypothetical protein n=1 Tax=Thermogemmatispora sp. TaxID=1968838 RepID=UPI0026200F86|nr:hypothetical protein [Thermogemmatispora sp.]
MARPSSRSASLRDKELILSFSPSRRHHPQSALGLVSILPRSRCDLPGRRRS